MKSIHDIRRKNLIDLIERDFNGVQTRLAERMDTQPNLVNRWVHGQKIIGDTVARKIEKAANKPTNWMDVDHSMAQMREEYQPVSPSDIGLLAAENLARWMRESRDLSTQGKLAKASGVAQSTLNRMLNNEVSISIANLETIAAPFGRRGYELLIHPNDPAGIRYDRARYALLPESEKSKIESFIDFVITQHANHQQ